MLSQLYRNIYVAQRSSTIAHCSAKVCVGWNFAHTTGERKHRCFIVEISLGWVLKSICYNSNKFVIIQIKQIVQNSQHSSKLSFFLLSLCLSISLSFPLPLFLRHYVHFMFIVNSSFFLFFPVCFVGCFSVFLCVTRYICISVDDFWFTSPTVFDCVQLSSNKLHNTHTTTITTTNIELPRYPHLPENNLKKN